MKKIFLGYYNCQKNDGTLFSLPKKDYKKMIPNVKKRQYDELSILVGYFMDYFRKWSCESEDRMPDRLAVLFAQGDIEHGYKDYRNFKILLVKEDTLDYHVVSGYRETREEILEIWKKINSMDYDSFYDYWTKVCEEDLVETFF
jgi:hypothetical protein